jgi:hypothetical protein
MSPTRLEGSNSEEINDATFNNQPTEDEQILTQNSAMSFSLSLKDVESDDDDMPIKFIRKRKQDTQCKTSKNKKFQNNFETFSSPVEDVKSDADDMPIELLPKRRKATQYKTSRNKKSRNQIYID